MERGVAGNITLRAFYANGTAYTGGNAVIYPSIQKDGGAIANLSNLTVLEVDSTKAPGSYTARYSTTEATANLVSFFGCSATANVIVTSPLNIAVLPANISLANITAAGNFIAGNVSLITFPSNFGALSISAAGNVTAGNVSCITFPANFGAITISAAGNVTAGNVSGITFPANFGLLAITGAGNITFGNSTALAGPATIALAVGGNITTDHGAGSYIRNTEPDNAGILAAIGLLPGQVLDESPDNHDAGGMLGNYVRVIRAQTDQLQFDVAGAVLADVTYVNNSTNAADGLQGIGEEYTANQTINANLTKVAGQTALAAAPVTFPSDPADQSLIIAATDALLTAVNTRQATFTTSTGVTLPATVASTTNITGGTITTVTNLTNLPTMPTDWLTAAGLSAGAVTEIQSGLATPTNITAGTITTVTNLTNAPTAGDLTATMKASVTAAVPSASAIATAVWATVLVSTRTAGWLLRKALAMLTGRVADAQTAAEKYADVDEANPTANPSVTVVGDASGNRTDVTYSP